MAAHLSSPDYFVQKRFNSNSQERGRERISHPKSYCCIYVMFDFNLMQRLEG